MPQGSLTSLSPSELFHKIRRIEIKTSRLVNEFFGGRYLSSFKGRGMEFTDIREYLPGDDIRDIHWKVTARLGHPYVKRYTEERELTILIAVDTSGSHHFGTQNRLKSELTAELVSLLAFSALKNNDKVGLLLFSDQIESYIPPRKSRRHALRLVRDVLGFVPEHQGTNLDHALRYLNRVQKKRAVVFLISDFQDKNFEARLSVTQRRHDTIAFVIEDPMEQKWPSIGPIVLEDAETGEQQWAKLNSQQLRQLYANHVAVQRAERNRLFSKLNIDTVVFQTDHDYVIPLMNFFRQRERISRR